MGALLSSGLTSNMEFRGSKPDSLIGQKLVQDRLTGPQRMTDFVIVRSATLTVDDPAPPGLRRRASPAKIGSLGSGVVADASTIYATNDPTLRLQGQARHARSPWSWPATRTTP